MHNPLHTIDSYAESIARSLDITVYSMEGLFEMAVRNNPSAQGIREFWMSSQQVTLDSEDLVIQKMHEGIDALKRSLSRSELDHLNLHTDSDLFDGALREAFGAFFAQLRTQYAKRLRDIVAARAFGTDTFNEDPKTMTRNGRRWDFTEYAYLTVRMFLMDWFNGVRISYLADQGVEDFTVFTNDPDAEYGTYKVEDYPQLAPELFHPRAPRVVGATDVSSEPEM